MLEGTFLEVMRLELHQALGIYWQMSHFRTYSQRGLADVAGIHRNSANQYCLFVREALAVRNRFTLIQPGGPGKKVFVDECWIGTRWKYHRGNRSRGLHEREVGARSANGRKVMLLVLSEHGSNRTVIFHIRKRDRVTIEPVFCRFVLPGSTVFTDGAPVYESINQWGDFVKGGSVNHSIGQFVRRDANDNLVSSNHVEGVIILLKRHLRKHCVANLEEFLTTLGMFGVLDLSGPVPSGCSDGNSLHFEHLKEWASRCICGSQVTKMSDCTCNREEPEVDDQEELNDFESDIGPQPEDQTKAFIYKELKSLNIQEEICDIVLTFPLSFDNAAIAAVTESAQAANIAVLGIIPEPLAYVFKFYPPTRSHYYYYVVVDYAGRGLRASVIAQRGFLYDIVAHADIPTELATKQHWDLVQVFSAANGHYQQYHSELSLEKGYGAWFGGGNAASLLKSCRQIQATIFQTMGAVIYEVIVSAKLNAKEKSIILLLHGGIAVPGFDSDELKADAKFRF
ncbi:hypothetical protein BV898_11725 [Hypsibius exemplaris]|uniref:ISXO2-like transposase domain-containing protein n=1 Tax=Hypsibius exemplaris TaxID=2072580 RepID=A0A1W0WFR5_HYPEX|nr:hypothetical protein BV898_11725 [Hypsibius exemplaris]